MTYELIVSIVVVGIIISIIIGCMEAMAFINKIKEIKSDLKLLEFRIDEIKKESENGSRK